MSDISEKIEKTIESARGKAMDIPAPILAICAAEKPGMSVAVSVKNVMDRFAAFNGDCDSSDQNFLYFVTYAIIEEVQRMLREDAKLTSGFKPGDINIEATGVGESVGANVNFGNLFGQIE